MKKLNSEIFVKLIAQIGMLVFSVTAVFPKVFSFGYHSSTIRIGYIGVAFLFLWLIKNYNKCTLIYEPLFFKIHFVYLVYLLIPIIVIGINFRSIGFWFWMIFNTLLLVYVYVEKEEDSMICWFKLACVFNSFIVIFNHLYFKIFPILPIIGDPAFYPIGENVYIYRSFGLFSEPAFVALAISPLLVYLGLNLKIKWDQAFFVVLTFSLGLTYSRTAILCLIFIFLLFLFLKNIYKKRVILISIVFTLMFSIFSEPHFYFKNNKILFNGNPAINESPAFSGSSQERLVSIQRVLFAIKENHLQGVGLGNSLTSLKNKFPSDKNVEGVHNLYLEILYEQGLFGLVTFLMLMYLVIQKAGFRKSLPLLFLLTVPFQFCQTMCVPVLWIFVGSIIGELNQADVFREDNFRSSVSIDESEV